MKWNPHFSFNGQCEVAFKFYERALSGKIATLIKYGDTPAAEHVPADHRSRIMHARLDVEGQTMMGADAQPGQPYEGIKGCSMAVQAESPEEAERMFTALSENGVVVMPLGPTFWAIRFGMVTDQFGILWLINHEKAT